MDFGSKAFLVKKKIHVPITIYNLDFYLFLNSKVASLLMRQIEPEASIPTNDSLLEIDGACC